MPIMGCHTTLGNPEYGNTSVYSAGNPWGISRVEADGEWYQEWDSALYGQEDEEATVDLRPWFRYYPRRPKANPDDAPGPNPGQNSEEGLEFRDYVRLVKAAALGAQFFKAYVFFKSMRNSADDVDSNPQEFSLKDYIDGMNPKANSEAELQTMDNQPPNAPAIIAALKAEHYQVLDGDSPLDLSLIHI